MDRSLAVCADDAGRAPDGEALTAVSGPRRAPVRGACRRMRDVAERGWSSRGELLASAKGWRAPPLRELNAPQRRFVVLSF